MPSRRRPRAVTSHVLELEQSERQWAAKVEGWLRFYGWRYHHSQGGELKRASAAARVGDRGFPDYAATRRLEARGPELAFLELKTERGRLGPGQPGWLEALEAFARATTDAAGIAVDEYGPSAAEEVPRIIVGVYRPSQARELEELLAGPRGRNVYVPGHRDLGEL